MAGKGFVMGMMLTRRELADSCDACHLGKQTMKPHSKKFNRGLKPPNDAVCANMLIPSQGNDPGSKLNWSLWIATRAVRDSAHAE
jgi:hypothetical protein